MKRGHIPVKDSEVLANGSNDHKINMRYEKPKDDVCPSKKTLKGVCPSLMTYKNQEINRVVRKSTKDMMNSMMGVCPSRRAKKAYAYHWDY